jgi:hypothetical protein
LSGVAIHQQGQIASGQQIVMAGDSHRHQVCLNPHSRVLLRVVLLNIPWGLEVWRVLLASDHWPGASGSDSC